MKARITIYVLALLLFNSCIVKSLFPFFTDDTITFEKAFLGIWQDPEDKDNRWIITSIEDFINFQKEKDSTPPSKEDLDFQKKYKHGYYAVYEEKEANRTSIFLVVPFKIKNQLFLDFTPFIYDSDTNDLVSYHLIPTHTLAKFDVLDNNTIHVNWLSSTKLVGLIETNKIKIKYEKLSPSDDLLLTASSEELQKFIAEFMDYEDKDKWETDVKLNLKRSHSKEESLNLMKRVFNGKEALSGNLFKP